MGCGPHTRVFLRPSERLENPSHQNSSNTEKHQKPEATALVHWLAACLCCQKHVARLINWLCCLLEAPQDAWSTGCIFDSVFSRRTQQIARCGWINSDDHVRPNCTCFKPDQSGYFQFQPQAKTFLNKRRAAYSPSCHAKWAITSYLWMAHFQFWPQVPQHDSTFGLSGG